MILEAVDLWKSYPRWQGATGTLRGALARRTPPVARRQGRRWALQGVDLAVEPGTAVGVVGHNGAGKSTLLRLCAGLGRPTRGSVAARGRVAAVLSLGSWFAFELTGRENAEIAALVLGCERREARALVPKVLEFAELEDFAEAPVRTYSDGMRLRLAFAVVAQLEPDLLLVDEALAVGDLAFQEKGIERLRELRSAGLTLLLASHDLSLVERECERVVWLDHGRVRADGAPAEVLAAYREAGREATLARTPAHPGDGEIGVSRFGSQEARVEEVRVLGPDGALAGQLSEGSGLRVELSLAPGSAVVTDPRVVIGIHRVSDDLLCHEASTASGGVRIARLDARVDVQLAIDRLDLVPGRYAVTVGLYPPDWAYAYDYRWHVTGFTVAGDPGWNGVVRAGHRWTRRG